MMLPEVRRRLLGMFLLALGVEGMLFMSIGSAWKPMILALVGYGMWRTP